MTESYRIICLGCVFSPDHLLDLFTEEEQIIGDWKLEHHNKDASLFVCVRIRARNFGQIAHRLEC